jgi:hypothetical protein
LYKPNRRRSDLGCQATLSRRKRARNLLIDPEKTAMLTSIQECDSFVPNLRLITIVITGFNTDVEHGGVVYHVQTEDKGLESPLILSLVYSGGAILASKRSPYEDLIAAGFDEAALAQRLKRQHRLICAAINAGRIDELKRMGEQLDDSAAAVSSLETKAAEPIAASETQTAEEQLTADTAPTVEPDTAEDKASAKIPAATPESPYTVYDPRRHSPLGEKATESGLVVKLVDEQQFRAGQEVTIKVLVQKPVDGKNEPVVHAAVSIKILGTTFRPQILSMTTERDGMAITSTRLPQFTSGRAAVLVRVDAAGGWSETRRVIHPSR